MSSRSNGVTNDVFRRRRIVAGQLVAALLAGDDRLDRGAAAGPRLLEQLAEAAAAVAHVGRCGVEQVEEPVVGGEQTEPGDGSTLHRGKRHELNAPDGLRSSPVRSADGSTRLG